MSDYYGLEVRDKDNNVIIDPGTFTVRQVARKFISANDLLIKAGSTQVNRAVDFPWAESKYGMLISITQLGLPNMPPTTPNSVLAGITDKAAIRTYGKDSLDTWLNNTPRLPVATAYDGYVRLAPAAIAFNANVWLSLYVVV